MREDYKTSDGKTVTVTKYNVTKSYYNGFAQHVLELDNGDKIYIDYGDTEVKIESVH